MHKCKCVADGYCSKLAEMVQDCFNVGGGCCAPNSDGTGTVSAAEKTSEER